MKETQPRCAEPGCALRLIWRRYRESCFCFEHSRPVDPDSLTLPGEEWKPIPEFPKYEASNLGRIRNTFTQVGQRGRVRPHVQKQRLYKGLTMFVSVAGESQIVGRMVLLAFVGPPQSDQECSHIDGKPANNRLDNICWETHAENERRKRGHGTAVRGDNHPCAKLTAERVLLYRQRLHNGEPFSLLQEESGVSWATFYNAMKGRTWKHLNAPTVN